MEKSITGRIGMTGWKGNIFVLVIVNFLKCFLSRVGYVFGGDWVPLGKCAQYTKKASKVNIIMAFECKKTKHMDFKPDFLDNTEMG